MPLASNPGQPQSSAANTRVQQATLLRAHYAVPKDSARAASIGFSSATASRASFRSGKMPGSNAVRAVRWAAAWRLPANERAHQILCLKRVPERFAHIALEPLGNYSLFDKFRRAVMKTWSALVLHEPALQDTPSTSWVALGLHWTFPHNPLLCLEGSMHVLANMMPIRPDAEIPPSVINTVVQLVESKRASLTACWKRWRIEPSEIISPMIKNLGVPILGEALWPAVFGACCVGGDDSLVNGTPASSVLEPSSSLLLFITALLLIRAPIVEKSRNRDRVFDAHNVLFQQDGGDFTTKSVCHVMLKFVRDLVPQMILIGPDLPRRQMVDFTEDDDYYPPLLNPDDEPGRLLRVSIPEFLSAVEKSELELAKRGISKRNAVANAGEAIAWSRALAVVPEQAKLEMMEKELIRRQNVKGFALRGGNVNTSSIADIQEQNQELRRQQDQFVGDTRYVSPAERNSNNIINNNNITHFGETREYYPPSSENSYHHVLPQAMSSLQKPPLMMKRAASAQQQQPTRSQINLVQSGGMTSSTIFQTTIPRQQQPLIMQRSSATRPPSSVAAILQVQQQQQTGSPYRHLLHSPSSSSQPSGVVNSPSRIFPNQFHHEDDFLFGTVQPPKLPFGTNHNYNPNNNNNNNNNFSQQQFATPFPRQGFIQTSAVNPTAATTATKSSSNRPTTAHRGQPSTVQRHQQYVDPSTTIEQTIRKKRPLSASGTAKASSTSTATTGPSSNTPQQMMMAQRGSATAQTNNNTRPRRS